VKIKALPPAYFTTNGSAYCDPAPFQKISGVLSLPSFSLLPQSSVLVLLFFRLADHSSLLNASLSYDTVCFFPGTTRPKQQNFRKKTDRSEYHEACLSLGRLQKML
jgi:hypothetical protein